MRVTTRNLLVLALGFGIVLGLALGLELGTAHRRPRSAECVPYVSRRGFGRDGYEERPLTEFKGTLLYIACWPLVSRSPLTDTDAMSFTA